MQGLYAGIRTGIFDRLRAVWRLVRGLGPEMAAVPGKLLRTTVRGCQVAAARSPRSAAPYTGAFRRTLTTSTTKTTLFSTQSLASCLLQRRSGLRGTRETSSSNFGEGVDLLKAAEKLVQEHVGAGGVVVFSKSYCPYCAKAKGLLQSAGVEFKAVELDLVSEGEAIQAALERITGRKTVPNVFVNKESIGGYDDLRAAAAGGGLTKVLASSPKKGSSTSLSESAAEPDGGRKGFDFDLVVIGGGSGGLAASKEAAKLGLKVAVFDYVTPTPVGTTWGLGGTCVNVGCIPKKLMHQAAILGESLREAEAFGWTDVNQGLRHDWTSMVDNVQNHIRSLNWGYKAALRSNNVKYFNELARFTGPNTLEAVNRKGDVRKLTAGKVILATGGRPKYPDIPGAKEFGITSDDIFSLPHSPGKTLLVGASYISLETAGFLKGLGLDVTIMVRSVLLRGFDQQMAEKIGAYMETVKGINLIRPCVPERLELVEHGRPGKVKVSASGENGKKFEDVFNTVIFAVGREAETDQLGLGRVGVAVNPKDKKILVDKYEQTNQPNIYAIGDLVSGKPELTPVAIQAGRLLARRLAGVSDATFDYKTIPTTVFTPIEYGVCGLSEEDAIQSLGGEDNVEVYHSGLRPLEWTVAHKPDNACYAKLVCDKTRNNLVVGFHYLGPNAGEVTQGFAGMMRLGAKKADFDDLVGIHPTCAEVFTTMSITKASGIDPSAVGC